MCNAAHRLCCLSEIALILVLFSEFSWNHLKKEWKIWKRGLWYRAISHKNKHHFRSSTFRVGLPLNWGVGTRKTRASHPEKIKKSNGNTFLMTPVCIGPIFKPFKNPSVRENWQFWALTQCRPHTPGFPPTRTRRNYKSCIRQWSRIHLFENGLLCNQHGNLESWKRQW